MNEPFTKRNYPQMSKWYWEWLQEFETMKWTYVQEGPHTIGRSEREVLWSDPSQPSVESLEQDARRAA